MFNEYKPNKYKIGDTIIRTHFEENCYKFKNKKYCDNIYHYKEEIKEKNDKH